MRLASGHSVLLFWLFVYLCFNFYIYLGLKINLLMQMKDGHIHFGISLISPAGLSDFLTNIK